MIYANALNIVFIVQYITYALQAIHTHVTSSPCCPFCPDDPCFKCVWVFTASCSVSGKTPIVITAITAKRNTESSRNTNGRYVRSCSY